MSPAAPCLAAWDGAAVHFGGDVQACATLCYSDCSGSLILGNLAEQSLAEILDGPRARELRRRLLEGDLDADLCCHHCDRLDTCNLYGDPVDGRASRTGILEAGSAHARHDLAPTPLRRLELCLTDLCNMRCEMCPLTHGRVSPRGMASRGFLPVEMLESCLRDINGPLAGAPEVGVWLHWIGEPLLHPELQRIIDCVAAAGERFRLHLVTNAIGLGPELCDALLDMPGRHSVSASLNALTDGTYQRVNGSQMRDRVYGNLMHFLDRRRRLGLEDSWTVGVSAVVVASNLLELPAFVGHWQDVFRERGGEATISLNGKGAASRNSIFLLTEVERPESRALFREALRSLDLGVPEWNLEASRTADAMVRAYALGQPPPANVPADAGGVDPRDLRAVVDAMYAAGHDETARCLVSHAIEWPGARPQLLFLLHRHDEWRLVVEHADRWLERDPGQPYLLWIRGAARGRLGDIEGALVDLERCLEGGGTIGFTYEVHDSLAEMYLASGDRDRAEEHARRALEIAPDKVQTRLLLEGIEIDLQYLAGQREQARNRASELLGASGAGSRSLLFLYRNQDYAAAEEQANLVLERCPDEPYALFIRGAARGFLGELKGAQSDLESCLAGAVGEGFADAAHEGLAGVFLSLGDRARAREQAELALAIAPHRAQTRRLLEGIAIDEMYQRGERDAARARVARALESSGADPRLLFVLHRNQDYQAVVDLASRLLERRPGEAYAQWIRGAARGFLGEQGGALSDLESCLAGAAREGFADEVHDSLARVFLSSGDRTRAREQAELALAVAPHREQTRRLLEEIAIDELYQRGEREAARIRVARALESSGADPRLLFVLHRNQDYQAVVDLASRLLERRPGEAYAQWIRGAARGLLGELDGALSDLESCLAGAVREGFADAVHDSLAEAYLALGDRARAREQAELALAVAPHKEQTRRLLEGIAIDELYQRGERDAARTRVARALESSGADPRLLFLLHRNQDFEAVVDLASRLLERRPGEAYARWVRGAARGYLGQSEAALSDLESCLSGAKSQGFADEVHSSLAEVYLALGDRARARKQAELALAAAPHRAQTRRLLEGIAIDELYQQGERDAARTRVARALESSGADPQLLFLLHRNQDFEAVVDLASRLLERRPGEAYAQWIRGAARGFLGELDGALSDLESCLAGAVREGFADAVHDSLAEAYLALGDRARAREQAELALAVAPHKEQTRRLLEGIAIDELYQRGERDAARTRVARALESSGADSRLLFLLHRNQDYRAVVDLASRLLERRPGEAYAQWIRGAARGLLGELDGALSDLGSCLAGAVREGFADAVHDSLAEAYLALGDLEQAEEHARRALEIAPHKEQTRRLLEGIAIDELYQRGERDAARTRVARALESSGADSRLLFLLHRNQDYQAVVDLASRLLERRPGEAYAQWIRGAARGLLGELDGALSDLGSCLAGAVREGFADAVHDSLAEAYLALGDHEQAEEHARRALEIAPHKAQTQRLLERIRGA